MRIGIIGGGTVGRAVARCYMEHHEVCVYDAVIERMTHSLKDTLASDLVFVCLPEDSINPFFGCNISGEQTKLNFVLKSTVPIGFTRIFQRSYGLTSVVHSPEFLTSRCSIVDAQLPARNIVGVPSYGHDPLYDIDNLKANKASAVLVDLLQTRFPAVPVYLMSSDESEAVKLMTNSFFAVKIAYFNECRTLCDKLHLDWDAVLCGVLADGRISHSHTLVPGPDGKRGFGGACLPKDLQMLIDAILSEGLYSYVMEGAEQSNTRCRRE